jgi:hypothetical protein
LVEPLWPKVVGLKWRALRCKHGVRSTSKLHSARVLPSFDHWLAHLRLRPPTWHTLLDDWKTLGAWSQCLEGRSTTVEVSIDAPHMQLNALRMHRNAVHMHNTHLNSGVAPDVQLSMAIDTYMSRWISALTWKLPSTPTCP